MKYHNISINRFPPTPLVFIEFKSYKFCIEMCVTPFLKGLAVSSNGTCLEKHRKLFRSWGTNSTNMFFFFDMWKLSFHLISSAVPTEVAGMRKSRKNNFWVFTPPRQAAGGLSTPCRRGAELKGNVVASSPTSHSEPTPAGTRTHEKQAIEFAWNRIFFQLKSQH